MILDEKIRNLISEAKKLISSGKVDEAKNFLVKAVRLAEMARDNVNGLEKMKYTFLINKINEMIKSLEEEEF